MRTQEMPLGATARAIPEHGMNVLPMGTRLGEFEIVNLIGEGGFGIVYLAYDHSLERRVALKEYMPSGLATRTTKMAVTVKSQHNVSTFSAGLKSFINEARLLAQFDSPSLVKVHRFWEGNGTAYMAMPYYQGITLKQALKERRIKPTEEWIRRLLADLFGAIETIHRAQCFHRDIAPDNILLLEDGRPLLLDFGAARRVIGDLTQCLTVILKPGFAPIEQYADIAGLRQGAWTDIYALAAVVYYLITGKAPPPAVARIVHDEMLPAREAGKGRYSASFLAVLDKALAVKPEHRYQSIAELRQALNLKEESPSHTLPQTATQRRTSTEHTAPLATPEPEAKTPRAEAKPIRREKPHADGGMQRTQKIPPPPARTPRNSKPGWLIAGLVLSAGIASGVFWRLHQPESTEASPADSSTVAQSSGASEIPLQEAEPSPATPLPASPPSASNAPVMQAPAQPPHADITATAPRSSEPPSPKPEHDQNVPQTPRPSPEDELWRKANAANKPGAYQRYLKAFPQGRYAEIARLRLESMQAKAAAQKPAPSQQENAKTANAAPTVPKASAPSISWKEDEALWNIAATINEAPAYEAYLHKYPNGQFAAVAKDRLANLKSAATKTEPVPDKAQQVPKQDASASTSNTPSVEDKQASIKPSLATPPSTPQAPPSDIIEPKPPAEAKPLSEAPAKKSLKVGNQTMIGDFTVDPKTGIVSGSGKILWTDGNRFEGTLVRGVKEGKGEFVWTNGQRYTGDWSQDLPNGKGTIVFPNGNRYVGEVRSGIPHGHGIMRFKGGDVYEGAWSKGKSSGQGRYTWSDGSYWEGEFSNDQRTENGKMVFSGDAQKAAAATHDAQASDGAAVEQDASGK